MALNELGLIYIVEQQLDTELAEQQQKHSDNANVRPGSLEVVQSEVR